MIDEPTDNPGDEAGDDSPPTPYAARELGGASPAAIAERHFLGALLHLSGDEARSAVALVFPTDLADPQLRAILTAARVLVADGHDPSPALIVPRMMALGLVTRDRAGLASALVVDLVVDTPVVASWPAWAVEILRESARRTIVETSNRAMQAADGDDLMVALDVLTAGLAAVHEAIRRALES